LKAINILSLVQAFKSLEKGSYSSFLGHYGIDIKDLEVEDLNALVEALCENTGNREILNQFYVGYKIPQIGKEFDLLRFGVEYVINIELKSTCKEERIKGQLQRNKYYLSYLGKKLYNFSFVSDVGQFYFLRDDEEIEKVDVSSLEGLLKGQKVDNFDAIDELFNPSDYLVSPFNSVVKFLDNKYFLTHQQEDLKDKILKSLNSKVGAKFTSVTGSAGTGKTLLIYDIVRHIAGNGGNPLIVHCGYLNSGQEFLKTNGWKIIPVKQVGHYDLSKYNVIFVDEAQRIYPNQLAYIVEKIKAANSACIFSYDKLQTLAEWEEQRDIDSKINSITSITSYRLSDKIRTNKEIASFIKMLFNRKRDLGFIDSSNVELNYFNDIACAKAYLASLDGDEWEVLRFTPSQYNNEHHESYSTIFNKNSHKVIGQEFDSVAVAIDRFFYYNKETGELSYKAGAYYHPVKMLFQNITRTRKKLNLVIIDNEDILNRCLSILKN
jgi:hypothetical protein